VPETLCYANVFASKIQLFAEMNILRGTRKTILFSNAPGIEKLEIVDPESFEKEIVSHQTIPGINNFQFFDPRGV
jgi:hypothetical protein